MSSCATSIGLHQSDAAIDLTAPGSGPLDLKVNEGQRFQEKAAPPVMAETPHANGLTVDQSAA